MTQLESARKGIVTEAMKTVAADENVAVETLCAAVADGTAVIPLNPRHAGCRPVGVGPVYATPTKDIPDPTLGLKTMGEMIAAAAHPAVAIGGIDATRLPDVIAAGARNYAVVRAVCQSPDPYSAILKLMAR